jgi:hypothetical protein
MGGKMRNFDYKKLAEKNWDNEILLLMDVNACMVPT